MKDQADRHTVDLFAPAKRGRGRPPTGQAMTNAERQRAYRQRQKALQKTVTVTKNADLAFDAACNAMAKLRIENERLTAENDQLKRRIGELENVLVTEKPGQGADLDCLQTENQKLKRELELATTTKESLRRMVVDLHRKYELNA